MSPIIFDIKQLADPRDAIHRAVEGLAAGKLVAMPTETVYGIGASGLITESVQRLFDLKNRPDSLPLVFLVKGADDALDYVPDMSPFARRIARKCWPGPLTVLFPGPHPDSVISRLPDEVQKMTCGNGWVALRVPADTRAAEVLRLNAGSVIMANSGIGQAEPAVSATELLSAIGDQLDIVIDGGTCRFAQPSTVIKIVDEQIDIIRRGVIDEQSLKRMSQINILVVCTGNTCRSPMAEGILKKELAERLGCSVESLEDHGYKIESAGVAAMAGGGVSIEAVEALRNDGIDISLHSSQPVTDRLIQQADLILTMTGGHRQILVSNWPAAANRTFNLARNGEDIADPIGLPAEYYEHTARQIRGHLQLWLNDPTQTIFSTSPDGDNPNT